MSTGPPADLPGAAPTLAAEARGSTSSTTAIRWAQSAPDLRSDRGSWLGLWVRRWFWGCSCSLRG